MATLNVEEWALKSIILNTADMKVPDSLKASASDMYGRGIDLHVTQGGEPADMTDMVVYLFWRHRNGNQDATTFEEVDASVGHFRLYYPPAMMYPGEVLARIAIYIGSEKLTGSLNFVIRVEPNPVNEDEEMAQESFGTFLEAIEALNELENTIASEWESLKEDVQNALDTIGVASGFELPVSIENGGTGNTIGQAVSATKLATACTIQTDLESTSAASFDGTANITPGVTGILPVANGGTGASSLDAIQGLPQAYFGKYERETSTTNNKTLNAGELTVVSWNDAFSNGYVSDSDYFDVQSDGAVVCKKQGMVLIVASSYIESSSSSANFGTYIYRDTVSSDSSGKQLAGCYGFSNGAGIQCVAVESVSANTPIYHVARCSADATLYQGNTATWIYIVYLWCS